MAEIKELKSSPKLREGDIGLSEHLQQHWFATAKGVTFENIMAPEYWAHVAAKIRECARIDVIAEDGTWYAELLVVQQSRLELNVKLLRYTELGAPVTELADGNYEAAFKGPVHKWSIIRKSDGAIVKDGMRKDDAIALLPSYLKSLAA